MPEAKSTRQPGPRWTPLLRATLVLDQEEHRHHAFDFLVVRETDDDFLVLFADLQILAADRAYRVFNVLLPVEGAPDLGDGRRPFAGNLVDGALDREVLVHGRQHAHRQQGNEADDDGPEQ